MIKQHILQVPNVFGSLPKTSVFLGMLTSKYSKHTSEYKPASEKQYLLKFNSKPAKTLQRVFCVELLSFPFFLPFNEK